MECKDVETHDLVHAFLTGRMSGAARQEFKGHVDGCPHCRSELAMAASLMLDEAAPSQTATPAQVEVRPGLLQRLKDWLPARGVDLLRPAAAFTAILLISLPLSSMMWSPTEPELAPMRGGEEGALLSLTHRVDAAANALARQDAQGAYEALKDLDRGSSSDLLYAAYRVRARSAWQLGLKEEALTDLALAERMVVDGQRVACVEADRQAIKAGDPSLFCPLPAPAPSR